ncbi:hypothetical protein [Thiococcus pfennigii]|jgi:hypothetical protein|uniref:hypothetical protein n=1 Tax=Thiococcus pfennigii TaxID=1057 RepID=UPI001904987A|nr:hypothetical protein [Thiococcus pfennigii]MBK1699599.1 hypothetical protein [Thiococcus pfennigii]MBK1731773.1 hypothetical protein [Thiococcus pfennigii]
MLSVNAIYENGKVTLLEDIPEIQRARVIVTVLEELKPTTEAGDSSAFDELIGIISAREDGSVEHDRYMIGRTK